MPFKYSKKVTLNEGDSVRVSAGPYFLSRSGAKIKMGEGGTGVFTGADETGKAIYVKFGHTAPVYVYIGPEYVSPLTGMVMRPHKIVKIRQ